MLDYTPDQKQTERLQDFANQHGWHIIQVKQALSPYSYANDLIVGKTDYHYNYFAHELIASKIYEYLINKNLIN
jgi:hypothetical protein